MALAKYFEDILHALEEKRNNLQEVVAEHELENPVSPFFQQAQSLEIVIAKLESTVKGLEEIATDPQINLAHEMEVLRREKVDLQLLLSSNPLPENNFNDKFDTEKRRLKCDYEDKLRRKTEEYEKEVKALKANHGRLLNDKSEEIRKAKQKVVEARSATYAKQVLEAIKIKEKRKVDLEEKLMKMIFFRKRNGNKNIW